MSFNLNFITGKFVLTAGIVGAAASSFLLGIVPGGVITGLMAFVVSLTYFSKVQVLFHKLLGSFAQVPAWPRFVALAIGALIAAHHGGDYAVLVAGSTFVALAGNFFNSLY